MTDAEMRARQIKVRKEDAIECLNRAISTMESFMADAKQTAAKLDGHSDFLDINDAVAVAFKQIAWGFANAQGELRNADQYAIQAYQYEMRAKKP